MDFLTGIMDILAGIVEFLAAIMEFLAAIKDFGASFSGPVIETFTEIGVHGFFRDWCWPKLYRSLKNFPQFSQECIFLDTYNKYYIFL